MKMDWGAELWDQFDGVDKHHQLEIDFIEKFAKFVKDRSAIEMEYAGKLRKLAKANQPKKKDDRNMFSTHKAFSSILNELNDLAGQHEIVAEEMLNNINKNLLTFCNELKAEKKKLYQEGRSNQNQLDQHEKALEQTKKKFEKEWKECERAHSYFEKLDNDITVTKIDVEKAKHAWMLKKDSVESCKTDYGASLQTFNKEQQDHYNFEMPKLFQAYKDADERRVNNCRDMMIEFAKIDMKVKPLVQKCLEEMEKAANSVNSEQDAQVVVEKLKSGFSPPPDKEFEDCTQPQQNHNENVPDNTPKNTIATNKPSNKKRNRWGFGKNKVVESPDYSHLPPEQRRKKLQKLINELKKDISKEEEGRKGLLKMQEVYRTNPALGDPDSLANQMKISTSKIEKLQAELAQLEAWHNDAIGSVSRASIRSTSSSSVSNHEKTVETPATNQSQDSNSTLNESSVEVAESAPAEVVQTDGDEFDEDAEPIGTCVALYDFDASSEGALSMKAGEKFSILEADSGDGWTRAMADNRDGYVPTSYLEVSFF